eukprot:Em0002g1059a
MLRDIAIKTTENQLCLASRLGGFGSIDCGLGIDNPTRHGTHMFVHFVEAPESGLGKELDLTNPKTFRDFSKPMGAQTEARLKQFLDRYKYFEDPTGENTPPYHYGTHYSSAMGVAGYMIRMEPFTQYFLKLQGGHFDLPDRLFHSIPDAWKSASQSNMADIKELIPEFFYMPEFLSNSNHFELVWEELNDIILPTWAKGDPHEFIRVHREALECDYVSAHLHEWIDLIFGYKQQGKEALEACNVFHHLFYEGSVGIHHHHVLCCGVCSLVSRVVWYGNGPPPHGVVWYGNGPPHMEWYGNGPPTLSGFLDLCQDIDKIEDSVKKQSTIAFIHNFGQMPRQLFKKPHRQRKVVFRPTVTSGTSMTPDGTTTSGLEGRRLSPFNKNLFQLMPTRDPILRVHGEVHQIMCLDKQHVVAVEKNRVLLPPTYNRYFAWGYPDRSARVAVMEKVSCTSLIPATGSEVGYSRYLDGSHQEHHQGPGPGRRQQYILMLSWSYDELQQMVKELDSALQSIGIHRQQYFGGAFIGNHVHKALKLANIQTLCKSLAQTALKKLSNRSTEAKHRSEMLVNAFSMFAQCHNIYDLNFIDEAQTHALDQSIEQFMTFFRESLS